MRGVYPRPSGELPVRSSTQIHFRTALRFNGDLMAHRRILLIGWDSADWRIINPLLAAGLLPNLAKMIAEGVSGNISSLYPSLSPMLWTSIATGKRPYKHGILGFSEPDPCSGGIRPVSNLSRRTKAIWNILNQNGKRCLVVGWWPSHPAEPLDLGVMVSNAYQRAPALSSKDHAWPMAPGVVFPRSLSKALSGVRGYPSQLKRKTLKRFVPHVETEDGITTDYRFENLTRIISDCENIHSAARYLIKRKPWDFLAVYYDGLDHFCHGFMRYQSPRQSWISRKDFNLFNGVVREAYRLHDKMLGDLVEEAGLNTTVLLTSDHGFHPAQKVPSIPIDSAGPAIEHRNYGIFVLKGKNIRSGQKIYGANLLDICPTLLSLFDLPVGQDMDGKPLVAAFESVPNIQSVRSWEDIKGRDGRHSKEVALSEEDSREALRHLEALGYIQPPSENVDDTVRRTQRELRYNLGCSYIDAQQYHKAAEIFGDLWNEAPAEHRHGAKLFACRLLSADCKGARQTFEELRSRRRRYARLAGEELSLLRESFRCRNVIDLGPFEQWRIGQLSASAKLSSVPMLQMEVMLLLAEKEAAAAISLLKKLKRAVPRSTIHNLQLARAYFILKDWDKALKWYRKSAAEDSDNADAYLGLAHVLLKTCRNHEAVDAALSSINLQYSNPFAHFALGVALHRIGEIELAMKALQLCLQQNSNFLPAHRRLSILYKRRLKTPEAAEKHDAVVRKTAHRLRQIRSDLAPSLRVHSRVDPLPKPTEKMTSIGARASVVQDARSDVSFITIVTGLPRSGTSLMMQMLAAGGLPPLQDAERPADDDNPRGYFEYALAKNIKNDHSWIDRGIGRSLKLVVQLLPSLPFSQPYRVIVMERSFEEIFASQIAMLKRQNKEGPKLALERLKSIYRSQIVQSLEVLKANKIPLLRVSHRATIQNPADTTRRLVKFLQIPLDRSKMIAAVEPNLYRQKQRPQTSGKTIRINRELPGKARID